ncbi:MAG TPA: GAF and ANTAR domain-containing protein [Actinomycetota bacterium]
MGQDELVHSVAAVSRILLKGETLASTLDRIARLAAELLPQADAATITIADAGGPARTASCEETEAPLRSAGHITVAELDAEQNRLDEGPCLAAMRDRQTIQIDSVHTETRWRGFCRVALAAGIESVLAVPLGDESVEAPSGAINFFARTPHVFTEADRCAANRFSVQAGVAAANAAAFADLQADRALLARRLEDALHSRAVIDQAVGILMERERLGPDEAFQMLHSASQKLNVKLRAIAAEIVGSVADPRPPAAAAPATADEGSA